MTSRANDVMHIHILGIANTSFFNFACTCSKQLHFVPIQTRDRRITTSDECDIMASILTPPRQVLCIKNMGGLCSCMYQVIIVYCWACEIVFIYITGPMYLEAECPNPPPPPPPPPQPRSTVNTFFFFKATFTIRGQHRYFLCTSVHVTCNLHCIQRGSPCVPTCMELHAGVHLVQIFIQWGSTFDALLIRHYELSTMYTCNS